MNLLKKLFEAAQKNLKDNEIPRYLSAAQFMHPCTEKFHISPAFDHVGHGIVCFGDPTELYSDGPYFAPADEAYSNCGKLAHIYASLALMPNNSQELLKPEEKTRIKSSQKYLSRVSIQNSSPENMHVSLGCAHDGKVIAYLGDDSHMGLDKDIFTESSFPNEGENVFGKFGLLISVLSRYGDFVDEEWPEGDE